MNLLDVIYSIRPNYRPQGGVFLDCLTEMAAGTAFEALDWDALSGPRPTRAEIESAWLALDLARAKADRLAAIQKEHERRKALLTATIVKGTWAIAQAADISDLVQLYTLGVLAAGTARLTTADGSSRPELTKEELIALGGQFMLGRNDLAAVKSAKIAAVKAATTVAQIQAVDPNAGWP